ncbi:MAG: phosphodiester glycosidase family protein [Paracoccus sp. (in: a-proteobacteria)]|nr:phosphodiester glycosidase family protein [Paracoccus sp. (in: a-proteobacteria)]
MLVALAFPAGASVCKRVEHDGQGYVLCEVPAEQEPALRLWQDGPDGAPLRHFSNLRRMLAPGETLGFAMNAGMFHADYRAVGLLVIDGDELSPIVTGASNDNFGMLPNGVFCSGGAQPFAVIESRSFTQSRPECRLATQSGPMLVIDGELHPRFLVDSTSRYIRNGVGVSADGRTAWFAISNRPVTFHEFGRFFRDGLGSPNALYLDGSVSRLYAPSVRRSDFGRAMGPIIGLVVQDG